MIAGNNTLVDQGYSLHTSPAYIPQEPKALWSPSTYPPIQLDITFLLCYTSSIRHLRLKMTSRAIYKQPADSFCAKIRYRKYQTIHIRNQTYL